MNTLVHRSLLLISLAGSTAFLGCSGGDEVKQPSLTPPESAASGSSSEAARVPKEGQVQANGITIAYQSFGPTDRETVLMIMGNGASSPPGPSSFVRNW